MKIIHPSDFRYVIYVWGGFLFLAPQRLFKHLLFPCNLAPCWTLKCRCSWQSWVVPVHHQWPETFSCHPERTKISAPPNGFPSAQHHFLDCIQKALLFTAETPRFWRVVLRSRLFCSIFPVWIEPHSHCSLPVYSPHHLSPSFPHQPSCPGKECTNILLYDFVSQPLLWLNSTS